MSVNDRDEGRHEPTATGDPWWAETFVFDLWSDGGDLGAFTWLTLLPGQRRAWYWSVLARAGRPLLHVADLELPLPPVGLRVRTTGLWADHQCEAAFEQWTVQNECHAVALDDPADAVGRAYGTAAPLALDVEWYATAPAVETADGYRQPGEVHAVIEVVGGPLDIVGAAARSHTWGPMVWQDLRPSGDLRAFLGGPGPLVVERVLTPDGWATSAKGWPE